MEPEKKSLEKVIPFGNHHFQVHVKFRGSNTNAYFYHQDIDDSTGTSLETRSFLYVSMKIPPPPDASKNTSKPLQKKTN